MLDFLLRMLLGLGIFALGGWLGMLVISILSGIVNVVAYFLARAVRGIFGIRGGWDLGATIGAVGVALGKAVLQWSFFIALFLVSFLYPSAQGLGQIFLSGIFIGIFLIWMPSTFLLGLFARDISEYGAD